jgi:hypothetical protein
MDRLGIECVMKLHEDYRNGAGNMIQDSVDFLVKAIGGKTVSSR